jgi:hypothetical protein
MLRAALACKAATARTSQRQKETSMSILIALTISIGALAVVATWLFLGPLAAMQVQIWQAFIAWGCFYHSGGKTAGLVKTLTCMILGAVVGMASVMLAGQLGALGAFAAPVAVGIGAAVLVLAAHVPALSTIPASVYGFASVAGLILLGKDMSPTNAIVPTIVSIVIGAAFGWVSEAIGGKLAKPAA